MTSRSRATRPTIVPVGAAQPTVPAGADDGDGDGDGDGPVYRVSRYTVYPTGYTRVAVAQRRQWRVFVEDSGDGWAVRWRTMCLSIGATWEFEPPAKSRTPEFLSRFRFTERGALIRAQQAVDRLRVDDMTYEEFVGTVQDEASSAARLLLGSGSDQPDPTHPGASLGHRFLNVLRHQNRLD